jgi:transcriptional regulator of acetoin/glycerol metabolism
MKPKTRKRLREEGELMGLGLILLIIAVVIAASVRLVRERMEPITLHQEVCALQERRVREALLRYDGNISEVARALGVGRAFVYRVMRRFR